MCLPPLTARTHHCCSWVDFAPALSFNLSCCCVFAFAFCVVVSCACVCVWQAVVAVETGVIPALANLLNYVRLQCVLAVARVCVCVCLCFCVEQQHACSECATSFAGVPTNQTPIPIVVGRHHKQVHPCCRTSHWHWLRVFAQRSRNVRCVPEVPHQHQHERR